ncbi:hypothetical protein RhoFasSB10_02889 [Rhodococcus fascians]|nr:hypothetical protein [Rhodococcus fascians]
MEDFSTVQSISVNRANVVVILGMTLAAVAVGAGVTMSPVLLLVPPVVALFVICTNRVGIEATFVAFAVFAFSLPTFLEGFSAAASYLTLVATFGLLGLAVLNMRHIRVAAFIRVSVVLALATSVIFLLINLAYRSRGYAITGWVSLVLPIAAVLAAAGSFTALRDRSPEKYNRAIRFVMVVLFVGFGGNAFLGLKQVFIGYTPYELGRVLESGSTYLVGGLVRPIGGYGSSQTYGLFMGTLAPFVLFYSTSLPRRWRGLALALAVIGLVGLVLSLLRGSMYGGLIAIALGLLMPANKYMRKGHRRARLVIPSVFLLIAGLAYWQSESPRWAASVDRLTSVFGLQSDTSFNDRANRTLPRAIAAFGDNLLGLGGGASGPVSQSNPTEAPLGALTTDNGYLNLGIQFGIIGLLAVLVSMIGVLVYLLRSPSVLSRSASLILVALLIAMVFGGYWNLAGPMAIAGILVGIGLADAVRVRAETKPVDFESPPQDEALV